MMVFSRYLRRDFLAILVRMTANVLKVHTSREDWRTRDGSLRFFARHWDIFSKLLVTNKGLQWFVRHFDQFQKILCNRKLSLFIFNNWVKYGSLFSNSEFEKFLTENSVEFLNVIESNDMDHPIFKNKRFGANILTFVRDYNGTSNHLSTRSSFNGESDSEQLSSPTAVESPANEQTIQVVEKHQVQEEEQPLKQDDSEAAVFEDAQCSFDDVEPYQWVDDFWSFADSGSCI
jgi:hypothetical protein